MSGQSRTVDLLDGAFDLNQRRKFELKNAAGEKVVDLYFKPITRADRKKLKATLVLMRHWTSARRCCAKWQSLRMALKPLQRLMRPKLQRQLPESVLNEIELFLFGIGMRLTLKKQKTTEAGQVDSIF